jgi:hypothetical protein
VSLSHLVSWTRSLIHWPHWIPCIISSCFGRIWDNNKKYLNFNRQPRTVTMLHCLTLHLGPRTPCLAATIGLMSHEESGHNFRVHRKFPSVRPYLIQRGVSFSFTKSVNTFLSFCWKATLALSVYMEWIIPNSFSISYLYCIYILPHICWWHFLLP